MHIFTKVKLVCSKEVDDIVYEVDCQMIVVKEGDVDIGMYMCILKLGA